MNKELLLKIMESGIEISHFIILQLIASGEDLSDMWHNPKLRGYRETLIRKGLVDELNSKFFVTDRGMEIWKECNGVTKEVPTTTNPTVSPIKTVAADILKSCKSMILERTGEEKLRLKTQALYLCSEKDLTNRLTSFVKKFNNEDLEGMKSAIEDYTRDILNDKVGNYPRTLLYFIWKDDEKKGLISDMLTYMETLGKKEQEKIDLKTLW